MKCEILLMASGFTNSGQEDRNEPKSEGPTTFRMCFIWISEQIVIICIQNINWLVCILKTEHVYCAVRTESLQAIPVNCAFKWLTYSAIMVHTKLSLVQNIQAPVTHPLQTFHTLNTHKGSFLKWPDIAQSML